MEQAQSTFLQEAAVPVLMLVMTSVVALIGFLLSRQLTAIDKRDDNHDERIRAVEMDVLKIKVHLKMVRPSDLFKTVTPPGESSA